MVNSRLVVVGRVCVQTFSLSVVEIKLHIIVFRGDDKSISNDRAVLRVEGLESLPIVELIKLNIINIFQEVRVLLDIFVEPLERVVEVRLLDDSMDD